MEESKELFEQKLKETREKMKEHQQKIIEHEELKQQMKENDMIMAREVEEFSDDWKNTVKVKDEHLNDLLSQLPDFPKELHYMREELNRSQHEIKGLSLNGLQKVFEAEEQKILQKLEAIEKADQEK